MELPLDYSRVDGEEEYGGFATNVSEGGLLVYFPEVIEKGALLKIVDSFRERFRIEYDQRYSKSGLV